VKACRIYVTVANLALSFLGEEDQIRDPDQDSHAARIDFGRLGRGPPAVLRKGKYNFSI
jgi:hypothetical protein